MRAYPLIAVFMSIQFLGSSAFLPTHAAAQIPLNLGFERDGVEGNGRPWGWTLAYVAAGAEATVDTSVRHSGARSLRITNRSDGAGDKTHAMRYWMPPDFARGKAVEVSGWLRTRDLRGQGKLLLEAWGDGVLAADSAALTDDSEGDGWNRLDLTIPVDSTAHSVVITAALSGNGSVWFDDLVLTSGGHVWESIPIGSAPSPPTLEWLAHRTNPFVSVDASQPGTDSFSDLDSFGSIVGNASIVSLGEATHGTSEFFRLKHRLLSYLVERMGFRVFAIEANQLAVEPINAYVRGGPGEVRTLMRAMFRVWNTDEVRDLITWLRAYNTAHPTDMVEFVGFDMQDPSIPIDSISAFLRRVDRPLQAQIDTLNESFREAWRRTAYPQGADSVRQLWYDNASTAYDMIATRRSVWLASTDSASISWTIQNANVVRQAALSARNVVFATRDSSMAENIRWIQRRRPTGTRMVVWAHDGHISRAMHEWANYWGGGSMGGWLARFYGDAYRAFGILTYQGSYSGASGSEIIDTALFPAPEGSLEQALHGISRQVGSQLLITDIRAHDDAPAWLIEPRPIRMIGYAAEDFAFATGISVGNQFDGVIFVDTTSPSHVIR